MLHFCRKELDKLLTDNSKLQIMELLKVPQSAEGIPNCDLCFESKPADSKCITCEDNMCAGCATVHKQQKKSKDHELKPLNVEDSLDKSFYCNTCNGLSIQTCSNHLPLDIDSFYDQKKNEVRDLIRKVKEKSPEILKQCEAREKELKDLKSAIEKEIDNKTSQKLETIKLTQKQVNNAVSTVSIAESLLLDSKDNFLEKYGDIANTLQEFLNCDSLALVRTIQNCTNDLKNNLGNAKSAGKTFYP